METGGDEGGELFGPGRDDRFLNDEERPTSGIPAGRGRQSSTWAFPETAPVVGS
jgi:hypothetical protein